MITHWTLTNFKSVRKATQLAFAPLTIFAGPNSSGKTTLLQSLLLISQTLAHKIASTPLLLNGPLVSLGDFDDVKCADTDANDITIGWVYEPRSMTPPPPTVSCELSFTADRSPRQLSSAKARLLSTTLTVARPDRNTSFISLHRPGGGRPSRLPTTSASTFDFTDEDYTDYHVQLSADLLAELRQDYPSARLAGCTVSHFLPQTMFIDVNQGEEFARTIQAALTTGFHSHGRHTLPHLDDITVPDELLDFLCATLQRIIGSARTIRIRAECHLARAPVATGTPLRVLLTQLKRLSTNHTRKLRSALAGSAKFERLVTTSLDETHEALRFPAPLSPLMAATIKQLDYFFSSSLRYLGPLRGEPKAFYPLAAAFEPTNVGLKGEHTAAVLDLHRDTVIHYMPSSAFRTQAIRRLFVTRALGEATTDWLCYLQLADSIATSNRGEFGHELTVRVPYTRETRNLTHVGVGVSQVIPILVAGLLASADTILVFEQPELHLHPKVQALLADFFLSLSIMGKQCIVETHSEHIINRLRLREATSVDPLRRPVKIYFVERDDEGSSFREVVVNEYGAIANWPSGFFDQGQQEAERILRAAMKKRNANVKGTD